MHEFVFPSRSCRREAAEKIHHVASNGRANPDIAVHNPDYIPFGFTVRPAHVPDLRIGPQIPNPAVSTCKVRILFFDKYFDVKAMVIRYKTLKGREGGVIAR